MAKNRFGSDSVVNSGYVLPESRSLNTLLDRIESDRRAGLIAAKSRQEAQQKLNKDFLDNQIKVKGGTLFQDELNTLGQQYVDMGAALRMKGINPYSPNISNPEEMKSASDYRNFENRLRGLADARDVWQKDFLQRSNEFSAGKLDEDSFNNYNNIINTGKLVDFFDAGIAPPQVLPKFDNQGFLKNIKTPTYKSNSIDGNIETVTEVPMTGAIQLNLENSIAQNPQAKRFYFKQWGIDESATPAKQLLGSSDPVQVQDYLNQYFQSPDGVNEALKIFPKGTVPSYNSPEYKQFLKDQTAKQINAENRYTRGISDLTRQKAAEVDTEMTKSFNFDQAKEQRAIEDQALQRAAAGRERARFGWQAEDRQLKNASHNRRDQTIQGLQVGNQEDIQNLRGLAKSKGGRVYFDDNNRLVVEWKDRSSSGLVTPRKQEIELGPANGNGYAQLNELLNGLNPKGKEITLENLQSKDSYSGSLVNVGQSDKGLTQSQIKYLRDSFGTDYKNLGDYLFDQVGGFSSRGQAILQARELLDTRGRKAVPK